MGGYMPKGFGESIKGRCDIEGRDWKGCTGICSLPAR
jgi:hypothetical protein